MDHKTTFATTLRKLMLLFPPQEGADVLEAALDDRSSLARLMDYYHHHLHKHYERFLALDETVLDEVATLAPQLQRVPELFQAVVNKDEAWLLVMQLNNAAAARVADGNRPKWFRTLSSRMVRNKLH